MILIASNQWATAEDRFWHSQAECHLQLRGTLTMLFQLSIVIGILLAQLLNIGTHFWRPYGWRVSLGAAALPGIVLLIGGLLLPETPNSLIGENHSVKMYLWSSKSLKLNLTWLVGLIYGWQLWYIIKRLAVEVVLYSRHKATAPAPLSPFHLNRICLFSQLAQELKYKVSL